MKNRIKLWDLPTRVFHWCLVALIATCWYTGEEEIMWLHFYSGYGIMGLVLFRVMWGLVGSSNSRFLSFIRPPGEIIAYLKGFLNKNGKITLGHNPMGGLSVLGLLGLTALQVTFGLFAIDIDYVDTGPLSDLVSYELASQSLDLHHLTFDLLLILVGLHVAMIVFYRVYKRDNLLSPMVTGYKDIPEGRADVVEAAGKLRFAHLGLAIALAALSAAAVWFIVEMLPKLLG